MYTLSEHASVNQATRIYLTSLSHEEIHGITVGDHDLEVLKTGSHTYHANPAMQGTQTQCASHLLRHPAGTHCTESI